MQNRGISYLDIENEGIMMTVINDNCRYKVPVSFDEEVKIITKLYSFNGICMKYHYEVYKSDSLTLSAYGESEHCFVDEVTRIPLNLKKSKSEVIKRWNWLQQMTNLKVVNKYEPCC